MGESRNDLDPLVVIESAEPGVEPTPLPVMVDEPDGVPVWIAPHREWLVRGLLLAYLCVLFLSHLGSFGLWDPWETHYGAVTTNMVETYDWVSPWWGYKEAIGCEPQQGKFFFSKPIFTFWTEAFFCHVLGRSELAIRLPMALLAILAAFLAYLVVARIWDRRAGLVASVVLSTSPQYYMISRQAQTDMPFVATMSIGLLLFMLAVFGPRERLTPRGFKAWIASTVTLLGLVTIPQFAIIGTDVSSPVPVDTTGWAALVWPLTHLQMTGWLHGVIFSAVLVGLLVWWGVSLRREIRAEGLTEALMDRWRRRCLLALFYVMIAQSSYAKGLLGFALPGLIIGVYLLMTGHLKWGVLKRLDVLRGSLLCLVVGLPWYVAMFAKHGWAYWQRFFIHDHFKRLASGVHQVDSGNFEHYIKWLGIGMFPWVAFVPLALAWCIRSGTKGRGPQEQTRVFLFLWFLCAFTLFTLSSTKFHHYIFPAMPALGLLVGLYLIQLLGDRGWQARLVTVIGLLVLATLARDLHEDPQHIRNLMTYKYDRPLPTHLPVDPSAPVADKSDARWDEGTFWRHTPESLRSILSMESLRYERWIALISILSLLSLSLFFLARTRMAALVALGLCASAMGLWSLNYYMPSLSPHWSQKYLFDTYYDTCEVLENPVEVEEAYTPLLARWGMEGLARSLGWRSKTVCEEDVISWLITWRGETYYSFNELQPIEKEAPQFLPYLEERNHGKAFYVLMERGKKGAFKSKLDNYTQKLRRTGAEGWTGIADWSVEIVHDENQYFQMIKATPILEDQSEEGEISPG